MSLSKKYQKSLTEQWSMKFKTAHPDGDTFDGVVIKNARRFIVLAAITDFEFNGFIILQKQYITGYRDDENEVCENRIIRQNGQIDKLKAPDWISKCESLKGLLSEIKRKKIWPSLEAMSIKNKETQYFIGPLIDVTNSSVAIHLYDATGQWDEIYEIEHRNVFKIEVGDRYAKHFNRYMKKNT